MNNLLKTSQWSNFDLCLEFVFRLFLFVFICFSPLSSIAFACFSKVFTKGIDINLACFIMRLWSDGNISLLVRYTYLSFLIADNTDTFAAYLLLSYCNFSSLTLSLIIMIVFSFFPKYYFWNVKDFLMQYIFWEDSWIL